MDSVSRAEKHGADTCIRPQVLRVARNEQEPDPTMGPWTQELALRRIATQRKKGGGDHELDPVCAAEWP